MDVGPGDFVECVDDSPCVVTGKRLLQRGRIYTVDKAVHGIDQNGEVGVGLILCEPETRQIDGPGLWTWHPDRFRPIRKPPIDALKRLLDAPADQRELEGV